jgi:hypothetical protein
MRRGVFDIPVLWSHTSLLNFPTTVKRVPIRGANSALSVIGVFLSISDIVGANIMRDVHIQ